LFPEKNNEMHLAAGLQLKFKTEIGEWALICKILLMHTWWAALWVKNVRRAGNCNFRPTYQVCKFLT